MFTCFLPSQFDLLEMDRLERPLVNLPLLLDPSSYVPDTVDLTDDAPARKYWLTCFEEALDGVRELWASEGLAALDPSDSERHSGGCFPEAVPSASVVNRVSGKISQAKQLLTTGSPSWAVVSRRHVSSVKQRLVNAFLGAVEAAPWEHPSFPKVPQRLLDLSSE
ncbi:hypothetical protein MC885_011283 [Smutsia gigantea]|nr:hypothetical protein MC885_011283 [Smutsia gigantea]